jgi:hypothetical protein
VGRPKWDAEAALDFRSFFERRRAVYALAEIRVAAHPGTPDEIAEEVARRLGLLFR